mgnify:CR=1 FL=1
MFLSHYYVSKFPKKASLKWFSKEIREHLFRGAVLYVDLLDVESVLYKKISDVNMPRVRPAGFLTVLFESNGTLVILIEYVFC